MWSGSRLESLTTLHINRMIKIIDPFMLKTCGENLSQSLKYHE